MSLALLAAAILGGALFTFLFAERAPLLVRLAAGVPVGLASLGLFGFLAASVLGLDTPALILAALAVLWPVPVIAARPGLRLRVRGGLAEAGRAAAAALRHPDRRTLALAAGALLAAVLLWRVYDRAMFVTPEGIHTGDDHNLGDLPFHIGIVMGFVRGDNFPPEHPELAGARLTYPFLVDMVSALLVRGGASLRSAFFWPGLLLALAAVALLHRLAGLLTRDALAAALTPALVLLSGGLGFGLFVREALPSPSPGDLLWRLPHDYTITAGGELRWGNALTTLLVPQRSFLLGLPLFLLTLIWWWRALTTDRREEAVRLMLGAGIVAGLLPLSHAHTFALALAMAACLALLFPRPRAWGVFFVAALSLAVPQLVWIASGTTVRAASFLGWHVGWDRGERNPVWFWLMNTGLFIPLLLAALAAHRRLLPPSLLRFYLPFTLCFLVPNVLRLSPWIWDNIKFLFYWYVLSAPLVALVLARLLRGPLPARLGAPVLLLALVASGALDVWRVASGAVAHVLFDPEAQAFAEAVAGATPPRAVIAALPAYDSPALLAGRRLVLGYPGHIWSQGLEAGTREQDLHRFYVGEITASELSRRYDVGYVQVGPRERPALPGRGAGWGGLPVVVAQGPYQLRRVSGREGAEGTEKE